MFTFKEYNPPQSHHGAHKDFADSNTHPESFLLKSMHYLFPASKQMANAEEKLRKLEPTLDSAVLKSREVNANIQKTYKEATHCIEDHDKFMAERKATMTQNSK
jgi:hypothetical protein